MRSLWLRDSNSWLNFSCHHNEGFLNVLAVLGWGLEESNVIVFSEFLSFVCRDLSGILHIRLVTNKNSGDIVWSVFFNFIHPVFDGTEGLTISNIVSDNDTMSTLVIAASDGLESFLTCSVPLKLFVKKSEWFLGFSHKLGL